MARIFITGSSSGLGQLAAQLLIHQGHQVVLHARNNQRAMGTLEDVRGAEAVLTGDLANMDETKQLAAEANTLGSFDAVIHNAGIYQGSSKELFLVNTLAPYILTCLIQKPERLIYLGSDMHLQGKPSLEQIAFGKANISYSDSKFYVLLLTKAVARKWPNVYANAVDPGWVPTKMGGPGAPGDLQKGCETQAWLAVSDEDNARVSSRYFHHKRETHYHREADNIALQEKFLTTCEQYTGIPFPINKD